MLQKLIKRMLSSILIHKLCNIFGEVCERGKQCLPKWYIENIKDYIPLTAKTSSFISFAHSTTAFPLKFTA